MAQVNDYVIEDGDGLTVLNDLTQTFQAVRDDNAGGTAPPNPVPGMRWRDTSVSPPVLRIRNVENSGWDTFERSVGGVGGYGFMPIGVPFPVWDHITGVPVPDNLGAARFIRLTAGLIGAGQYNNGLLSSESVSGSSPSITATGVIATGPANGQVVALVNTEQAFIRPRTTSGLLQTGALQDHVHDIEARIDSAALSSNAGGETIVQGVVGGGTVGRIKDYGAPRPDGTGQTGRGGPYGDETRPRNRSATFYMRIL